MDGLDEHPCRGVAAPVGGMWRASTIFVGALLHVAVATVTRDVTIRVRTFRTTSPGGTVPASTP